MSNPKNQIQEPHLEQFRGEDDSIDSNAYFKALEEYRESQKTFSHLSRVKLDSLLDNLEWQKAIDFATITNFSDSDKGHFSSKIQKLIKKYGGIYSEFNTSYGHQLTKLVPTKPKKLEFIPAPKPIDPPPPVPIKSPKPWVLYILIYMTIGSVGYLTLCLYQVDPTNLVGLSICGWVIWAIVHILKNSKKN